MHCMHCAVYSKSSVCPPVRPSVTLYCDLISWVTSKIITRIIRLGSSLLRVLQHRQPRPRETPQNRDWVAVLSKPAMSPKRGEIEAKLPLIPNRQLYTHFRLAPKSTTLDDLAWPLRTLFQITGVSEPITKIWMKVDLYWFPGERC